jgi:uncharacterized metal-binding protein
MASERQHLGREPSGSLRPIWLPWAHIINHRPMPMPGE